MPDLIVNELSFRNLDGAETQCAAADVHMAKLWMSELVDTIRTARKFGLGRSIRTDRAFLSVELCRGYRLPQWRNDASVDRDERTFLSNLAARSPYLDGVVDEILDRAGRSEVRFQGHRAEGLLAALLLDGVCVSWASHEAWNTDWLLAQIGELSEDGYFDQIAKAFRHASRPSHWTAHAEWIEHKQKITVPDGAALLAQAAELFPRLEFCGGAPAQVRGLNGKERYFDWVIDCLFAADRECASWTSGEFPHSRLPGPATGESASVHSNPELKRRRMFGTLAGDLVMFEHHMKHLGENKRIHYCPDEGRRRVMIAYLGDKLPTGKYRT